MKKLDREKIKNLYDKGLNDCEIGRILNCSGSTITLWRKSENLEKNFKYKKSSRRFYDLIKPYMSKDCLYKLHSPE